MNEVRWILGMAIMVGCSTSRPAAVPAHPVASVALGACAVPERDGVVGRSPRIERADRDLNGDGALEIIAVDRRLCSSQGNCYWNVFLPPPRSGEGCLRYAGTFAGAAPELLTTQGEDKMRDIRGQWNLHGGRISLETYRFVRGAYQRVEALICRRVGDDRVECTDDHR